MGLFPQTDNPHFLPPKILSTEELADLFKTEYAKGNLNDKDYLLYVMSGGEVYWIDAVVPCNIPEHPTWTYKLTMRSLGVTLVVLHDLFVIDSECCIQHTDPTNVKPIVVIKEAGYNLHRHYELPIFKLYLGQSHVVVPLSERVAFKRTRKDDVCVTFNTDLNRVLIIRVTVFDTTTNHTLHFFGQPSHNYATLTLDEAEVIKATFKATLPEWINVTSVTSHSLV